MSPPIGRIEGVHPEVARALRAMSGMERLRLAHETWEMVRDRLAAYLTVRHPDWCQDEVERAVALRLLSDSGLDERQIAECARRLDLTSPPKSSLKQTN